jgi:hypothetical protein
MDVAGVPSAMKLKKSETYVLNTVYALSKLIGDPAPAEDDPDDATCDIENLPLVVVLAAIACGHGRRSLTRWTP